MAGVRHETPLPLGGLFEPGQHDVHGAGQPVDLVAGAGFGNPTVQIMLADVRDLPPDRFDGVQRTADRP